MNILGTIESITLWFKKARPVVTNKSFQTQMGVHFEEVSEMLAEISGHDGETRVLIEKAKQANHLLAEHLKNNSSESLVYIEPSNYIGYLDALCDQIVTATGCAYDVDFQFDGAMHAVDSSNWSKFVNGEPIFDENGKIAKGPDYVKADLSPFI